MRPSAIVSVALALALAGCAARGDRTAATSSRASRGGRPHANRPGYAPALAGVRLRPRTAETDLAPHARADDGLGYDGRGYGGEVGSLGPTGYAGESCAPAWVESQGQGYAGPGGYGSGYAGPGGAVPPGMRAPYDAPILRPASPYRGPTDPPDVFRRPGTTAGNEFFSHR